MVARTGLGLGALLFGERLDRLFLPALVPAFSGIVLVNRPTRAGGAAAAALKIEDAPGRAAAPRGEGRCCGTSAGMASAR